VGAAASRRRADASLAPGPSAVYRVGGAGLIPPSVERAAETTVSVDWSVTGF